MLKPPEPITAARTQSIDYQRTYQAVVGQVDAMGMPRYEIGLLHPQDGMLLRTWSRHQLLHSIGWLRHMNAKGCHVYLRPADSYGVVLLDDLDATAVSRLKHDGLQPAAVVETSKDNYQSWIRLIRNREQRPIPADLIHQLLLDLVNKYGADPGCSDWRHFGRLAGFTNQKPCHACHGRQPFVLLRFAAAVVAPQGRERLLRARLKLRRQAYRQTLPTSPSKAFTYADRLARIMALYPHQPWAADPDYSRLDFMIARDMLREGLPPGVVAWEINASSPNLHIRKPRNVNDYIRRTIRAAQRALLSLSPPLR